MELQKSVTTPSVRTSLSFTETEVIEALKCHAETKGFRFKDGCKLYVWFSHPWAPRPEPTKLVVDTLGTVAGISKESE